MFKMPTPRLPRRATLGCLLVVVFLSGCSSTSQPQRPAPTSIEPQATVQSAPPVAAETRLQAEQKAMAEVDDSNSIFFALGSSTVTPGERGKLTPFAQRLKDDKELDITLIGHTDDNGSLSLNVAVADARIASVSAILKRLGVRTQQIKKKVSGSEKSAGVCRSEACRQKMRRVELVFSTPD
jgi:outer membrane protein OmpA-like peptidoglycan-associated protein